MTPKQARFAEEYILDHNGAAAAVRAGYAPGPGVAVTASRLLRKANVQAALQAQEALVAADLAMTHQRVVAELLRAVELAREQANPAGMISGWREIARICGLYAPERVSVGIETSVPDHEFTWMSDAELMAIVAEGGDGSTATSMTNGFVVHEATPASGGSAFSRRMTTD